MSNKEIKPCPQCLGDGMLQDVDLNEFVVQCKDCGFEIFGANKADVIKAWNERNYPEKQDSSKPIMIVANPDELKPLLTRSDIEKMGKPL